MHHIFKYGNHVSTVGTVVLSIIIIFAVLILIDLYVHKGLLAAFKNSSALVRRTIGISYWIINIGFIILGLYILITFSASSISNNIPLKLFAASFVVLYVPKVVFGLFLLVEDVYRLLRAIVISILRLSRKKAVIGNELFQSRRKFIAQTATLVAGIPFVSSIYGITKGKYHFRIHKAEIAFKDLPKDFDGFTITQVSDMHSGSFGDMHQVMHGVELANQQNSQLMLFTGDLVNFRAHEMDNWVEVFKQFNAPMGKYSILGNHDYGDYVDWPTEEDKKANLDRLCDFHRQLGFTLLRNENIKLHKNDSSIELLGSENWGRGGFSKYGDLNKTIAGTTPGSFKVLMTHDPTHWEEQVMNNPELIHLTLSGHTHGMQLGFEIPGFIKFSPVEFRYKRWAGLYTENGRYLYVNRGFGYIGFPGRVGIWPEITVITLRTA